jgi:hypothetical protein
VTAESSGVEPYLYPDKYKALTPNEDIQGEGHYLNYINNHPTLTMNRFRGWGSYGSMFKRQWLDGPPKSKKFTFQINNVSISWNNISVEARFEEEAKELAKDVLNERMALRMRLPPTDGWNLRLTEATDV